MNSSIFKKEFFISLAIFFSLLAAGFLIVFAVGKNVNAEQSSGLVSKWDGDKTSGITVIDSNSGNNGAISGGVTIRPGEGGKNFHFDGFSGYVKMGNPKNLNFGTGPFSLEVWFNLGNRGRGIPAGNIIRKSNYPEKGPGAGYWLKAGGDDGLLEFFSGETTGIPGEPSARITTHVNTDTWYHVIATKDVSGMMKLYVNGELKGTAKALDANTTSNAPFTIGAWDDRFGVREFFFGVISRVSVYRSVLDGSGKPIDIKSQITYPVAELGNCRDEAECHLYCEKPEHSRACLAFVKKYGLASPEEIAKWEEFIDVASGEGPGGCKNEKDCISYCEDAIHIVECTDFVAKHNLASPEDLAEMQKIAKAVKAGAKLPGGCHNKAECIAYCEDTAHSEECVLFGEKAGFISKEDAEFIRKSGGKSPGDCAKGARSPEEGKKVCSAFCAKSENQKVCMDFAVQVGIISEDDAKELGGGGSLEDFNACLPHIDQKMLKCFDVLGKDAFEKLKAGEVPDDLNDMKAMIVKMKEVKACVNKGVDESFAKLPPDGLMCLEKELGPNPIEQIKSGRVSCRDFSGAEERIKTCMIDKQLGQLDECLNLSCSEVSQCINKLGGGEKRDQSELDPTIKDRMGKIKEKMNSCVVDQIRECLAKDCGEMMSCMSKLQGHGGEEKQKEGSKLDPGLEQEINAKMTACMKQQGGGQGGGRGLDAGGCAEQGGIWDGKQCDFSKKGAGQFDASECEKQGGAWNGGQCDFSKKGAGSFGAAECSKQGGIWDGKQCDFSKKGAGQFGATECTKQGGVWDGQKCDFSQKGAGTLDQSGCLKQGGIWDGKQCDFSKKGIDAQYPQSGGQIPQEYCSGFSSTPSCSYIGSPDSENYKLCKQCFPNK